MADANWLKVSLTLNGELAEAVAEVLDRFVANGVVIESKIKHIDAEDMGSPEGTVIVSGYLFMDALVEQKKNQIEEALWHLGQIQALPPAHYTIIKDKDWMTAWRKHYHPIRVGERLEILPAWVKKETPGCVPIRIDPGMAFGTGTHPSTQLCLEHIEKFTQTDQPVIDIGCGSGILSIAAIKLGASHALAVDIDPAAIKNTRINGKTNGILEKIETGLGSVKEILNNKFSIRQAPLVVVNILAPVIKELFRAQLATLVSDGGFLILAGILDEQFASVDADAQAADLTLISKLNKNDWVSPVYQR